MLQGFREVKLKANPQWAVDVFLLRPTPVKGDPWGVLAPLRGTPWEQTISVIDGATFSHALHGHTMPLIRALKAGPKAQMTKMRDQECALKEGKCLGATDDCRPCGKMPECYAAPLEDTETSRAASVVALAWRKGYHVVVVTEGGEFAL